MRAVRWLPALALLALLVLLPLQAWLRALAPDVLVTNAASGIRDLTWRATVGPAGDLAVEIDYALDATPGEVSIRVPPNATRLRVDGRPLAADLGRYVDLTADGPITVAYVVRGAVTRYGDGAVVAVGALDEDGDVATDTAMFSCVLCYFDVVEYGDLAVQGLLAWGATGPGEAVRASFGGFGQLRAEADDADGATLRFVGSLQSTVTPTLLVQLPASAVPDLPVTEGSAAAAFDQHRADLGGAGLAQKGLANDAPLGEVVVALLLTAIFVATAWWIVWRLQTAWRAQRDDLDAVLAAPPPDAPYEAPSRLEPALAAVVVGGLARDDRCPVAGTILGMARAGIIEIHGLDSQRFTLRLPPGAEGRTKIEEAVLAELRPQGNRNADTTLTGPPLWGDDRKVAYRRIMRAVVASARDARLIRLTLSALVLVPVAFAMGLIGVIGSGGDSILAWIVLFGGPVLAVVASVFTGFTRTRAGRAEHDRWTDYARWLRTNLELGSVGAPAIAIWDTVLPEAAAIGAAPTASRALSPEV